MWQRATVLGLLLVLMSSCGASAPEADIESGNPPGSGFPTPATLSGRQASNSLGFIYGSECTTDPLRQGAGLSNSTIYFIPADPPASTLADCAYCFFRLPVDDSGPLEWKGQWHIAPAAGLAWLGIGNLTLNRWEWTRLDDPQAVQSLGDSADYRAPDGTVLLALMLYPGAGPAELDFFTIEARPESGWRFTELFSNETAGTETTYTIADAAIVGGKPACTFWEYTGGQGATVRFLLFVCDDVVGTDPSAWHSYEFSHPGALAEVGGAFGMIYTQTNEVSGNRELHYMYSQDPSQGFSDEVVSDDKVVAYSRLGDVAGRPGIVFGSSPNQFNSSYPPYYACSDAAAGGNWTVSKVSETDVIANAVTDGFAPPLDLNGVPALGFYAIAGVDSAFKVAVANSAAPADTADWTVVDLGEGADNDLYSFSLDGDACFASVQYVSTPKEFWTYHLTGADPTVPADWTVVKYDALGIDTLWPAYITGVGSELAFLLVGPGTGSDWLDGSAFPLNYWHSGSAENNLVSWQQDKLESITKSGDLTLLSADGQPAISFTLRTTSGRVGEERTYTRMYWAVYVP